jgi:16S rRNA C967 or C1407 C5-methylase (RsmB/RsmF family)
MDSSGPINNQGKSLADYRAANQKISRAEAADQAEAARVSAPQGKSIQGYGKTTGPSVAVTKPAVTPQGKRFQDYLATSQGKAASTPAPAQADTSEGKSIADYATAAGKPPR